MRDLSGDVLGVRLAGASFRDCARLSPQPPAMLDSQGQFMTHFSLPNICSSSLASGSSRMSSTACE